MRIIVKASLPVLIEVDLDSEEVFQIAIESAELQTDSFLVREADHLVTATVSEPPPKFSSIEEAEAWMENRGPQTGVTITPENRDAALAIVAGHNWTDGI